MIQTAPYMKIELVYVEYWTMLEEMLKPVFQNVGSI